MVIHCGFALARVVADLLLACGAGQRPLGDFVQRAATAPADLLRVELANLDAGRRNFWGRHGRFKVVLDATRSRCIPGMACY
jgi:hypothetical protein